MYKAISKKEVKHRKVSDHYIYVLHILYVHSIAEFKTDYNIW